MALKVYGGIMGSGKTYEVVSVVIRGALAQGRRVVSNIAGLNFDEIRSSLLADGIDASKIGEIVQIDHAQVVEPNFWRTDKDDELGITAFVQPGDLLALDEIWRFWEGFKPRFDDGEKVHKRPDRVMNFFRMHRHFTHPESGVACDVALITQDPMIDIHRSVRGVVEETYIMEKLTEIGSSSRYRVNIFKRCAINRKPLRVLQREYNSKYFGFYKSHSQKKEGDADAVEVNIDRRGNILAGPLFRVVLPIMVLIVLPLAFWRLWVFFHPSDTKASEVKTKPGDKSSQAATVSPAKPTFNESDNWRAVGFYSRRGSVVVVASDGVALRGLTDPPQYKIGSLSIETFLPSGEAVTSWTGHKESAPMNRVPGGAQ